jgi:heme exporter protein A
MSTALLDLDALRCVRGDRLLFDGVSVAVGAGRLLRVRGANGAGKTSLLRMVCGLALPAAGTVRWNGRPVASQRDELHPRLVYLGHAPALKDDLSATENLQAAAGVGGFACSADEASAALAAAGLRGRERLPARALSQGQRKRVGLARLALGSRAAGPTLWVLDEPFSALDPAACTWLHGVVDAQLARGGVVVLTSHQQSPWDGRPLQVDITLRPPPKPRAAEAEAAQVKIGG